MAKASNPGIGAALSAALQKEDQAALKRATKKQYGLPAGIYDLVFSKESARCEEVGSNGYALKTSWVVDCAYTKDPATKALTLIADEQGNPKRRGLQHTETFFLQTKDKSGSYRGLSNSINFMEAVNTWLEKPVFESRKALEAETDPERNPGKTGIPFEKFIKAVNPLSNLKVRMEVTKSQNKETGDEYTNTNWRFKPKDGSLAAALKTADAATGNAAATPTTPTAWEKADASDSERPPVGFVVTFTEMSKIPGKEGTVLQYKETGDCIVKLKETGKNVTVKGADINEKLSWVSEEPAEEEV